MEGSREGQRHGTCFICPQEPAAMSKRKWMLAIAAFMLVVPRIPAEQPLDSKRFKQLVTQLGSRDFREREEATQLLIAAGPPALEYLHNATSSSDAEIRRRARGAVEKIEKKIETTRLLKPRPVHLVYRDTPIAEAVADFAKKSGYPLQLEGDPIRWTNRKITLDTGEVPFWGALDQFCRASGLIERRALPPANQSTQAGTPQEAERRLWEKRMLIRRGLTVPPARVDFGKIVLADGKAESLPNFQMGGVRIRILPPNTPIPDQGKAPDETRIALDVAAEPGIDWRGVLDIQVQKAIDFQSREVVQVLERMPPTNNVVNEWEAMAAVGRAINFNGNNGVILPGSIQYNVNVPAQPPHEYPLRFRLKDAKTKALREVQGVLFAQVQTPQEPLIRADKILQAEGKTYKGPEDSYLKIHEVRQDDRGQVQLRITLRTPSMSDDALGMMGGAIFVRRFNGRMAFMAQHESENVASQNLALQDTKGQAFQLTSAEETTQINGTEVTQEFRLVFQNRQGLEPPARLVYSGHRLVTVEIPFMLKNVPLKE
jgi:hypothetical protein